MPLKAKKVPLREKRSDGRGKLASPQKHPAKPRTSGQPEKPVHRPRLPPLRFLVPTSAADKAALGSLEPPVFSYQTIESAPWGPPEANRFRAHAKAIFRNPEFRKDVQMYKTKYPAAFWQNLPTLKRAVQTFNDEIGVLWLALCLMAETQWGPNTLTFTVTPAALWADYDAHEVCRKWGLDDWDFRWVQWLAVNWDPQQEPAPSKDPPVPIRPDFSPLRIVTEEGSPPDGEGPRRITLTIRRGTSKRSALRALNEAFQHFEGKQKPEGRPALVDDEFLHSLFSQHPVKPRGRKTVVEQVYGECQKRGVTISRPALRAKYQTWLAERGYPIKRYQK